MLSQAQGRFPRLATTGKALLSQSSGPIHCKYLMNNIPRNTTRIQLLNSLLVPPYGLDTSPPRHQLQVLCGCVMTSSRLDDELNVAVITFSDTPRWLRELNYDVNGFPKKSTFGTIWRAVNVTDDPDEHGRTEFHRAVMADDLLYAEMLAEFDDTDVNVQDEQGRTALHWACARGFPSLVMLCLSVPGCDVGLKDNDGLTAFDIARQSEHAEEAIQNMFYKRILELEKENPQTALLQLLTITSEPPSDDKPIFPGEAMFEPIIDRNSPLVIALLNRGIDLKATNGDGNTALHVAAAHENNADIATRLLEAGSDVNAIGNGGATPIHHASTADQEMVRVLLNRDADITIKDTNGMSPLHWAAQDGHGDIARLLLHHGVDLSAVDNDGRTALQLAEESHDSQSDLVVLLRDATKKQNADRNVLVGDQVEGSMEMVVDKWKQNETVSTQEEIEWGQGGEWSDVTSPLWPQLGDIRELKVDAREGKSTPWLPLGNIELKDEQGLTPLLQAVIGGNLERVCVLLENGADVNARERGSRTALHLAAQRGHIQILNALLAGKAQIHAVGNRYYTALHCAAEVGQSAAVIALLESGAQIEAVTESRWTALHFAAQHGNIKTINALLAGGGNIQAIDNRGYTVLHVAAEAGKPEAVNALLKRGADIEGATKQGWTPMHVAAMDGKTETINTLLECGGNAQAMDYNGYTPLHLASEAGRAGPVYALLRHGAEIEARTRLNRTGLHVAAVNGMRDIVSILLAAGAKLETKCDNGQTALHLAAESGQTATVVALLAAGSDIGAKCDNGETALHLAAESGQTESVIALLTAGADIGARSTEGTALQLALENGEHEIVALLEDGEPHTRVGRIRDALRLTFGRKK